VEDSGLVIVAFMAGLVVVQSLKLNPPSGSSAKDIAGIARTENIIIAFFI
jgi:hypothetical protein